MKLVAKKKIWNDYKDKVHNKISKYAIYSDEEDQEQDEEIIDLNEVDEIIQEEREKSIKNEFKYDKDNINLKNINIELMHKEDVLNFLLSDKATIPNLSSKNLIEYSSFKKSKFVSTSEKRKRQKKTTLSIQFLKRTLTRLI